jgi:hypothetical protein
MVGKAKTATMNKLCVLFFVLLVGSPVRGDEDRKFVIHVTRVDRTPYHEIVGGNTSHQILAEANSKTTFFRLSCEDVISRYEKENWACVDFESGHDYVVARSPGGGLCPEYDRAAYHGNVTCYTILAETEKKH